MIEKVQEQLEEPISNENEAGAAPVCENQEEEIAEIGLEQLPEQLQAAVRNAGWDSLMPVQRRAIPYLMEGRDLMVQSRTGSGKTGAFLLPIMHRINPAKKAVQALVLVPTRELARQVGGEADKLFAQSGLRSVVVYGGVAYGPQIRGLKQGAQLVVGTPGRILDHLMREVLSLRSLSMLVFDEADRMMSMGFYPDMQRLRGFLPRRRINSMFSATYPPSVISLAETFLNNPERLNLSGDTLHVVDTDHSYCVMSPMEKDRALIRLIEMENPESALIFCNTKAQVEYVSQILQRFGYHADLLTSDLSQKARERVLASLRDKKLRFLVATDVAARGIDIHQLSHVFLYEFPEEIESYIHRAGRTGRAGAVGTAISLVGHAEEMKLKKASEQLKVPMLSRELPSDEDVEKIVSERLTVMLESELRSRDQVQQERMQRMIRLARSLGEEDDELQVIAMLLDDYYQKTLHAPPGWTAGDQPSKPPGQQPRPKKKRGRRRHRRR